MKKLMKFSMLFFSFLGIAFLMSCDSQGSNQSVKVNTAAEIEAEKKAIPDIADASFKDGMTFFIITYN